MSKIIDKKKLFRQLKGCVKFINYIKSGKKSACLEYATGVGKTFCAIILIKKVLKKWKDCRTIIIVPTTQLKQQWEKELKINNLKGKIYVVNTIALSQIKYSCDFLILDEAHLYPKGLSFSTIFNKINHKLLLCLTATVTPELLKYTTVVDTITQKEAKDNGWISNFIEYNLPVELTPKDRLEYTKINREFNKHFAYFNHDFNLAMKCRTSKGAKEYADIMGWDAKEVAFRANRWGFYMKERKEWLYNTENKINLTIELINKFKVKTAVFSESILFADRVKYGLGETCISYHSKIPSELRYKGKTIAYIIKEGKNTVYKDLNNEITYLTDLKLKYPKLIKVGKTALLKENLIKFSDNRYKINEISSAKALKQGFNVEDIELGVRPSRTNSQIDHTQMTGRICRNFTYKDGTIKRGVFVNIYVPGTQDEKWLKNSQTNPDIIWINSIDEIKFN